MAKKSHPPSAAPRDAPVAVLVRRFYAELWEAGDFAVAGEILSKDLVFRGSLGDEADGIEGFLAYARKVRGALAEYRCEILDLIASDERAAALMRFSGLHRGVLLGVSPTGRRVAWPGGAFFTLRDDRLTRISVVGDTGALASALAASDLSTQDEEGVHT